MATKMKEDGNSFIKKKEYSAAVRKYEEGVEVLDRADGYPMLRSEVEQMIALKVVLHSNMAQALLSSELYRRAVEAATKCLELDEGNSKALHRRSLAFEALRNHEAALKDAVSLQKVGGGSLSAEEVEKRITALQDKIADGIRAREAESSEDEMDNLLVRMKARFDEVVAKYDLQNDDAASQVADWLTSGEWKVTIDRVAKRWSMEHQDAEDFLLWIAKGLEFKEQQAAAAQQMSTNDKVENLGA